jgi:Lactonase, 7-bladed beta-propeller
VRIVKATRFCACIFFTAIAGVAATPARAQTQTSEHVYTTTSTVTDATGTGPSIINGFTVSSGTLTTTPGTPYSERIGEGTALAADMLGRFLFVANFTNNSISMFQIDSSTGALTEVQASPFCEWAGVQWASNTDRAVIPGSRTYGPIPLRGISHRCGLRRKRRNHLRN